MARGGRASAPSLYTDKDGWKFLRIWGMGIAGNDLDGDGYPEYFLTSMADNKLQTLIEVPADGRPRPGYKDIAFAKGVTAHRPYMGDDLRPSTGWHTQFEDVNNDGLVDLFIAKGNVAKMPDFAAKDPNNLLVQGADGKFTEAGDTAGVASIGRVARRRRLRTSIWTASSISSWSIAGRRRRSGAIPRKVPATGCS